MGLRERASDYSKAVGDSSGIDLGLELKPATKKPPASSSTPDATPIEKKQQNVTSSDFPETMGHKSRLDAVLNLIEVYKEFGQVRSSKDLWEVIAYSLMAQLGTKYIAIFMEDEQRMELKYALGFTLASDYSFAANSQLCLALAREKKALFIDNFIATFSEREEKFLTQIRAKYAIPVFRYEEIRGVIFINPPQNNPTFDNDDLFYLKICGELLGAMESQLRLISAAEERSSRFDRSKLYREYVSSFSTTLENLANSDSLRDAFDAEITRHFPESALLLLTREDFFLRRHSAIGFSGENVAHLEVNLVDSVIEKIKQGQETITAQDFEESDALSFLSAYKQATAYKILHHQEFIALAFIIENDKEKLEALKQIIRLYVLQNHIATLQSQRGSTIQKVDNPVIAIKSTIDECEENLTKTQEPYSIIVTSLANYTRLSNLYGDAFALEIRDFTRKALREILDARDFSTEVFNGHFVSILRQKEAGDAWRLSRIVQKQAAKIFNDEDKRPIFQHKIYARPSTPKIKFELLFKS
ncbi:MAG: hypothetical protein LDLANPLL_02325 [Turneriella sp.]|nr:hypothetical protein [Turneriella sp.]